MVRGCHLLAALVVPDISSVGLAAFEKRSIQAFEITGSSPLDPNAKVTNKVLSVKHLLEPLARGTVFNT